MTVFNPYHGAAAAVLCLSGCASIPDVSLRYYPTDWRASVTVTQTLGCIDKGTRPLALHTVSVVPLYFSRDTQELFEVRVAELDRWFADAEMSVSFTDDGRLKSVNQSATGQGEAIAKATVTLLSSGGLGAAVTKQGPSPMLSLKKADADDSLPGADVAACRRIAEWGGGDPITLTYKAGFGVAEVAPPDGAAAPRPPIPFKPTPGSAALHKALEGLLPALTLHAGTMTPVPSGAWHAPGALPSNTVALKLQRMVNVGLKVQADGQAIGSGGLLVPTTTVYELPMPKAALFGKQGFSLALADSGAVLGIGYGKTSGAAGAGNALAGLASAETTAYTTQAAALKAEADYIAQQQRLMRCQMNPKDC